MTNDCRWYLCGSHFTTGRFQPSTCLFLSEKFPQIKRAVTTSRPCERNTQIERRRIYNQPSRASRLVGDLQAYRPLLRCGCERYRYPQALRIGQCIWAWDTPARNVLRLHKVAHGRLRQRAKVWGLTIGEGDLLCELVWGFAWDRTRLINPLEGRRWGPGIDGTETGSGRGDVESRPRVSLDSFVVLSWDHEALNLVNT